MAAKRTSRAKSIPRLRERLTEIVRDKNGAVLETREDAATYVLEHWERRPRYQSWQRAAELLFDGGDIAVLTRQLKYAMLLDGILDLESP